jgi:hypothetical protein
VPATEGALADRPTQLILDALGRAAADPGPLPLFSRPTAPGLFPRTAAARLAARRCLDEGYLRPARSETNGKPRELVEITDQGRSYLAGQLHPRQVLDDCVRALEARQSQLAELVQTARRLHEHLDGLKALIAAALPRLSRPAEPAAAAPDCGAELQAELERWHGGGAPDDCPLPELFRRLHRGWPALTVGAFHDVLRRLHAAGRVYLHPWTGPLYELPEPAFALLAGHEIAYYASLRAAEKKGTRTSYADLTNADRRGTDREEIINTGP